MPQYKIYGVASVSKVLGVIEAPTKDDAIKIAWNDDRLCDEWYMSLCHRCANKLDIGDIYQLDAEEEG
jgi:hypothetical protein